TPEQLVRDLLVLGASADVELGNSVGLMSPHFDKGFQPRWMGQLVWALPIFAFFLVVSGLVWWGRELSGPIPSDSQVTAYKGIPDNPETGTPHPRPPDLAGSSTTEDEDEIGPADYSSTPTFPKNILVSSKENLLAKIEMAPPRSIISLSDDGPYEIGGLDQ